MVELDLRVGQRLRSQVDTTEVIVVRAPTGPTALTCGGQPLVDVTATAESLAADPTLMGGSPVGKRFTSADGAIELLVTKAGEGSLGIGVEPLAVKSPRPLPSSD